MVASHEEVVEAARGQGKGVGEEPQGDGGASECVCPKCGAEASHEKGVPCSEQKCPKCGATMGGAGAVTADQGNMDNQSEGGSTVEIEEIKSKLDQALADLESARQERDKVATERDELTARVTTLEASVTDLQAKLDQAEEERRQVREELVWQERSKLLASVLSTDELERQKPVIMAMSDEAVQLLAKVRPAAAPPSTLTANLGDSDEGGNIVVTLA
jgi:DNA repair exonuclease SbcCD ATPase subunit